MKGMSKKNCCYLCGGRLSNGYCAACGLDNTKLERVHYHLNESNAARRLERGRDNAEERVKPKKEKEKARIKPAAVSVKKTSAGGKKKVSSLSVGKIKLAVGCIGIFVAVAGILVDYIEEKQYDFTTSSYEDNVEYDYDPYEYLEKELPAEGEYFETELTPGEYLVGVHLPEGNYSAELLEGSGGLDVEDDENGIYLWESFGTDPEYDEVTEMEDIRLFQGAKVRISSDVKLKIATENGQTEAMSGIPNTLTDECILKVGRELTAGEDFLSGVYDVQVKSGWAVLVYKVPTDEDYVENGMYERSLWLDADESDGIYRNLVLPKGTVISTEEEEIVLTPSEVISPMDYTDYYEH